MNPGRLTDAERDARLGHVIGGHFHAHLVTHHDFDEPFAHLAGNMGEHFVSVGQAHLEHGACQHGADGAFHFNFTFGVFFLGRRFAEMPSALGVASSSSASLRARTVGASSGAGGAARSGCSRSCGLSRRAGWSGAIPGRSGLPGTGACAGRSCAAACRPGAGAGILAAAGAVAGSWIRADRILLVRLSKRACTKFAQANNRPYFHEGKP